MSDDELLASVMRKLLHQRDHARTGPYVEINAGTNAGSMCVDGWIEDLTADEVAALERAGAPA